MMTLQGAIYARRSEKADNLSPENQVDRCLAHKISLARQLGQAIDIVPRHIYVDEGVSGKDFDRRAYLQLRTAIERGEIQILIANDLSRLGRTPDPTDMFLERKFCIEHGVKVYLVKEGLEITDPAQGAVIQFFFGALFAGGARLDAMWRTGQGKEKARQSRPEAISYGGQPPYGYMSVKGIITPNPDHLATLTQIFELGAQGITAENTALTLNRQGTDAPRGRQWHTRTIQRIWLNTIYTGVGMQVNYIDPDTHEPMQVVYPAPALVDAEVFAAVQRQAAVRKRTHHVARSKFWLSGLAHCGLCGLHFNGFSNTKAGTRYYRCDGRGQYKRFNVAPCPMPIIPAHLLEGPIWDDMCMVLSDPTILTAALADRPDGVKIADNLAYITQEIATHKREIGRLAGDLAREVFTADELRAAVAAQRAIIEKLEAEQYEWELQRLVLDRRSPVEVNLDGLPAEAKATLAQQIVSEIKVARVGVREVTATTFYFLLPDVVTGGRVLPSLSTCTSTPLLTAATPALLIEL